MTEAPLAEKIEFVRSEDLAGIEILRADNTKHCFRWFHQTYSVNTPLNYQAPDYHQFKYRGKSFTGFPGETMMLEPGEIHSATYLSNPVTFRVIMIPPVILEQCALELDVRGSRPHLKTALSDDSVLFKAFRNLHASIETDCTALERQSRFVYCVRHLLRAAAEIIPKPPPAERSLKKVKKAVEFLKTHWAENITLDQLVKVVGLNRFYLSRVFTREMGIPPHAFQIQLRIARVREFLKMGVPISEIALAAGFTDQSHMDRHFKKITGTTPARYAGLRLKTKTRAITSYSL